MVLLPLWLDPAEIFETFETVATSAVSLERRAFAKTYLATMATLSNI